MARAFASISFTNAVKAAQERYGSRAANLPFEHAPDRRDEITGAEAQFIAARDSFYMATVSESGWPYVQHRGGAPGFLKVMGPRQLGFADFRGNLQYLSVGNLAANDKVSLILVDYPNRRRLKIWGRARIIDERDHPDLVARLEMPAYRARVERGVVIEVEACDWNCPQHITPRYTEAELGALIDPLRKELEAIRSQRAPASVQPGTIGAGALELVVSGVRALTPRVRAYELRHPQGASLPAVTPGSHLPVPVVVDGRLETRHYSICSDSARRDHYEIAVLAEQGGRGGSRALHEAYRLGLLVRCGTPRNDFALDDEPRPAVLIAGGIGITPLRSMAYALVARRADFHLHYAGRSLREMAFTEELRQLLGPRMTCHPADRSPMDVETVMGSAPPDAVFYVCGPSRLLDGVRDAAANHGIPDARIRSERFTGPGKEDDQPLSIKLRKSDKLIEVKADETILAAVSAAGVQAPSDCRAGTCGTCAVKILDGIPDHRDVALTAADRARGLMCICVSRAHSPVLELDL